MSSTTSSARPTESASSASSSGWTPSIGSDTCTPSGSSRLDLRERNMSRDTRATIVVSHPPRFSTPLVSQRCSRSQVSWTASSASLSEPSIRYATALRWVRCVSNCAASSLIGHIPVVAFRLALTDAMPPM